MTKIPESLQDFTKSLMDLDVTKGAEEVLNKLAQLQVPGVDMDALVASQRDNLEALSSANRAAMEGIKGVGEWQIVTSHVDLGRSFRPIRDETQREVPSWARGNNPLGLIGTVVS